MPLPRWLLPFFPRKPSQTDAPPPPGGEGWGGGPGTTIPTPPSPPGGGETPDHSHRIHIAANDPAFPAKREAAVALICNAITDIVAPFGYTCKGTTWSRQSSHGRSAINLQRSRYGFSAHLTLRFLTPDGAAPATGIWAKEDDITLAHFADGTGSTGLQSGEILYLDVVENPGSLDLPLHILATRALPWLEAHHSAAAVPDIEDYLPR